MLPQSRCVDPASILAQSPANHAWAPLPCRRPANATDASAPPALMRALVIATADCYPVAAATAAQAGFTTERLAPAFVKHAGCSGNVHQMNDGQVNAHREAWRAIVASGVPTTIFEDDIRLLSADGAADARAMVARCAASGCDVQYLGIAGDYFSTHAYHITPNAAAMLLRHTKARCNDRKQDYALRSLCTSRQLRCTKPITMLTPVGRGFVSGWGLFVQDHRSFAPYTKLSLGKKNVGLDYLSRAQSHSRCAPRQQTNGTSPARSHHQLPRRLEWR